MATPSVGCRLCGDCHELAYPTYGGAWERTRRDSGRVGSIFDPAGGRSPELEDRETPRSPDQWERLRAEQRPSVAEPPEPDEPLELGPPPRTPEELEAERRRRQRRLEQLEAEDINQG